jgi:hypothetical protein
MVKVLLVLIVIAVLMEDSASIKKSEEEKREEEELAKAVNATLAEEEKKKREEEDEKKRGKTGGGIQKRKEDEASSFNCTCPVVDPCPEVRDCAPCAPCPGIDPCPEEKPCEECPEIRPCLPCRPCGPCPPGPVANNTSHNQDCPASSPCQDSAGMSVPVALLVGACAGALVTGVATGIGLILRYVPPTISGFIFVATIVFIWYFCSHYPETARELGGRAATLLREAATALGHWVMEVLRHHNEQVGFPVNSILPIFCLRSMFI